MSRLWCTAAVLVAAALIAGSDSLSARVGTTAAAISSPAERARLLSGEELLSTHEGFDSQPSVAYNARANEYLVVWNQDQSIVGQRLSYAGVLLGDVFTISASGSRKYYPVVAYSARTNGYLAVWEEVHADYDIAGQLIDAEGRLLDNPTTAEDESHEAVSFAVYDGAGDQQLPAVDSDGSSFFVAWQGPRLDETIDVVGRFVEAQGAVLAGIVEVAGEGDIARREPSVTYSATTNEYLVAFQAGEGETAEIHVSRVHPAGTLIGSEERLSSESACIRPDAAALPDGAYVVVYECDPPDGDSDIHGRRYDPEGEVTTIELLAPFNQRRPAVACALESDVALVTWRDERNQLESGIDVFGQRLRSGVLVGSPFPVSSAPRDDLSPVVAASQEPDGFLVVWEGQLGTTSDLFGQRVAVTGALHGLELGLAARPGAQRSPDLAYNPDDDQYLAVWSDDGSGYLYGQRLDGRGAPVEAPWPLDTEGANVDPSAAYHEGRRHYLAVWGDAKAERLELRTVPPGGEAGERRMIAMEHASYPRIVRAPGDGDRVLVVWQHEGRVRAASLYGDGGMTRQGMNTISSPGGVHGHPAVAADTARGRYLAAWETDRAGGTHELRARFVDTTSAPEGAEWCAAGCADADDHVAAALGFDASRQEYLLVHAASATTQETRLVGQRLTADGVPVGPEFDVAAEATERHAPLRAEADLVYSPEVGSFFTVWPAWGVDGARMDLFYRWIGVPPATSSAPRTLVRTTGDQYEPVAALSATDDRALVAWTDGRREGALDVYSRSAAADVTAPEARLTCDPTAGPVGTTFTFSAEASRDDHTPAHLLPVRWDWTSDGRWDTGWSITKVVTRTIELAGIYTVTVQVADLATNTDAAWQAVRVHPETPNQPPSARLTARPRSGVAGATFTFDASGSSDAETPSANLEFRWDWHADGRWDTSWGRESVATQQLVEAGEYAARIEVRDAEGLTDAATATVTVQPGPASEISVAPRLAVVGPGETVRFRASGVDAYGNGITTPPVEWSIVDESVGRIDARGVFTAGLRTGRFTDVVRAASANATARASVWFVWPFRVLAPWAGASVQLGTAVR